MRFHSCLLVPLMVSVLAVSVAANERDDFVASQKALDAAPAYRAVGVATSAAQKGVQRVTLEVLRPDLARMKTELDGKPGIDCFSDGKKTVVSMEGGAYRLASPDETKALGITRAQLSVVSATSDDFTHKVAQMKQTGHEAVNGVPASLYTGEDETFGMHVAVKLWISDKDHLPLQWFYKTSGKLKMDASQGDGEPMDAELKVTLDYDPAIKIVLPEVK